jgi:hypothetical protein
MESALSIGREELTSCRFQLGGFNSRLHLLSDVTSMIMTMKWFLEKNCRFTVEEAH